MSKKTIVDMGKNYHCSRTISNDYSHIVYDDVKSAANKIQEIEKEPIMIEFTYYPMFLCGESWPRICKLESSDTEPDSKKDSFLTRSQNILDEI